MADVIEVVNLLREAVLAMEKELGINPKKVYSNVRARLDILENRINNPSTPSPSTDNPFIIGTSGLTISAGDGEPASAEAAGSIYLRSDGNKNEKIYTTDGTNWSSINEIEQYKLVGEGFNGDAFELLFNTAQFNLFNNNETSICTFKILIVSTDGSDKRAYFEYRYLINKESNLTHVNNASFDAIELDNSTGWGVSISEISNKISISINSSVALEDRRSICILEIIRLSEI